MATQQESDRLCVRVFYEDRGLLCSSYFEEQPAFSDDYYENLVLRKRPDALIMRIHRKVPLNPSAKSRLPFVKDDENVSDNSQRR